MDLKSFESAVSQIAEERGIPKEKVLEIIEAAIAAAYKKDYGKKGQIIKASLDPKTGEVKFRQIKLVVDKDMIYSEKELEKVKELRKKGQPLPPSLENKVRFNPEKHIMIEEAKKINPDIKPGEDLEIVLETRKDYGRIAAQTAKQVILQRVREAEKETIYNEFKEKEGKIVSGIVQRIEGKNVYMDLGKTLGILPKEEQVPGEFYRPGQRLKVYVMKVEQTPKGPIIFLSRSYPKILTRLFELEVPEIASGTVVIKSIAREPGSRSKVAVASTVEGVDPIGSMVGQKGTRVSAVINELGGEKIDIIEWKENPEQYIANALAPAKVLEVKILPQNKALAIVPDDQLSLAIGRDGQNVRLAAKLTGWRIDVKSLREIEEMGEEGLLEEEEKEAESAQKETPTSSEENVEPKENN